MSRKMDTQNRAMIEQKIFELRYLQKGCELSDSDFFTIIASVFNQTESKKESEMILTLVKNLKTRERASKLTD